MKYFPEYRTLALLFAMLPFCFLTAQKKEQLFRPNDKDAWYSYTPESGRNNDTGNVFDVGKKKIHVSGKEFGYLSTKKSYGDFHLSLEFKWGEKKYPPRENAKRDAGILYHVDYYDGDIIWPRSLEYQIQEGDCGDFWMTDSTTIVYKGMMTKPGENINAVKTLDAEKPHGKWNKAEVIVKGGEITHLLNGKVVNTGSLGSTKSGQIVIQSEGAELYYRNIVVEEL